VSKVEEIEQIIEQLPAEDFEKLSLWVEQRRGRMASNVYPKPTSEAMIVRNHSAFLNGYSPEDEGIYDDATGR